MLEYFFGGVYNKYEMIKIGTQNREISQVLSQVLEYFFGGVYNKYEIIKIDSQIREKSQALSQVMLE